MPPSLLTTSPVAAATSRIIAAYLSNHKLSPSEAAVLSTAIAETLVGLANGAVLPGDGAALPAQKAAPKRQSKPRLPREARAIAEEPPAVPEPTDPDPDLSVEPVTIAEPEPEPEAAWEPEAALPAMAVHEPNEIAAPVPELAQAFEAEPAHESGSDFVADIVAQEAAADALDMPRKRKRPSRPRSRRGGVPGGAPASDEAAADE